MEKWIQKVKLGSDNLSVHAYFIIVRKDNKNYIVNLNRLSNILKAHNPEDVEIVENEGILQFKEKDGLLDWIVAVKNDKALCYDIIIDPTTFKNFIARELKKKPKEWRDGQFIFNFLDILIPGLSRELQYVKKVDCFYLDSEIPEFLNAAVDLMEEKEWL